MVNYDMLVENLERNNFKVFEFERKEEVKEFLENRIDSSRSIGFGGSMTVKELDLYDMFKDKGNQVYWHWGSKNPEEEKKNAINSNIYIASTNALTLDGKIVNRDGFGNRVASMVYGPSEVYLLVGENKICRDYYEAIERIETVVAPMNGKRLGYTTPCVVAGVCTDCNSNDRMCNVETIIHKNPSGNTINICIIKEDLGY